MKQNLALTALFALQLVCGLFLFWDILTSLLGLRTAPIAWALYELIEIGAVVGLIMGVGVSARLLVLSVRRQKAAETGLRVASGAFMDVLEERFTEWGLTPAERDVALFAIKGLSTAEIAAMRSTSEGTVKAQTNAIYRKAGVSGRPQLLSLFIDDLMGDALPGVDAA
ncbi:helix-turn-helix transcriptional regulator [Aestuariicoccus sp. MJ-SS9]|uniref:helix-turn-helix transcriptional regulator n=1 Tax=Aestuariicoccus sp. MJ-SS9 TaxID=3079855 RepID=UPI00290EFB51|nr:helix-turn-helix transcriptional regulator [Aestuariicoccus sp. MJ-SS9]MDU8912399.1 helix-turn-helix transcriptional regulator [Aestuariicoccus sp. MJ-SS9]